MAHFKQETVGCDVWYQECPRESCRGYFATHGKSRSTGWVSEERAVCCPRCAGITLERMRIIRPAEVRVVRRGDGQVLDRFAADESGRAKADALLASLK